MRKFGMNSVIASIAKQSLLALFLSIALIACGGDSGTSPNSEEKDSSSSIQKEESSSSSSNKKEVSSSSSQKIASSSSTPRNDVNSSSSKRSEGVPSSSSQKIASSSSVKTVSSSSVALSSSSKQSSSSKKVESSSSQKIASSSSVSPASSSSKKESSSSEYVPFDHSHALAADWRIGENRYKTFVDPRNGRSYYYITIPGTNFKEDANGKVVRIKDTVTIMAENLNIGKMVFGENNQNDDGEIERYCYNNDTTYCDEFGGLYQWAEMMQLPSRCNTESCAELIQENHRGICPEGWRLMTYDDYKIIENADGNEEHGVAGLRSGYRFNGYNTTGFSLVGAGLRTANGGFDDLFDVVYWVYPEEHEYDVAEYAYAAYVARDSDDGTGTTRNRRGEKKSGRAVRCVKLE